MTVPRITIVTPSYNQDRFLEATLDSVLSQGYPNLEYIVMDGGSTDGSVEIIRRYEKHLAYWVSERDGGQSVAINRGFARATGDILNWINSDDRLKQGALKAVAEMAADHPRAGAWVGGCELVDEHGRHLRVVYPRGVEDRAVMADWGNRGHFFQPSCFFSRAAWDRYGPIDESLYACFDFDFYLKAAAGMPFVATRQVLSEASIHRDAKTTAEVPRLRAERYLVQARHGFRDLAQARIERAERDAIRMQRIERRFRWIFALTRRLGRITGRKDT